MRLLELLTDYARLVARAARDYARLMREYGEELDALHDPHALLRVIDELSDEEAGRILRVYMLLSLAASRITIEVHASPDELDEIASILERASPPGTRS